MYKKIFLSIIGTLLLGSSLTRTVRGAAEVSSIEIKACSEYKGFDAENCLNDGPSTALCIKGLSIYKLNGNAENACLRDTPITLTKNELYLLNPESGEMVKSTGFGTKIDKLIANPGNYVLIDCDATDCKQTQGYVKTEDAEGQNTIYSFEGTKVGKAAGTLVDSSIGNGDSSKCVSTNVGKIFKNLDYICTDVGRSVAFDANTNLNVISGSLATGTALADDGVVILKTHANYIVKDKFAEVPEKLELKKCTEYNGIDSTFDPDNECTDQNVHDKLCIHSDNKIYSLSSDDTSGTIIYKCRKSDVFTPLVLNSSKLNVVKIDGTGKSDNKAYTSSETIAGLANPEAYILVDCSTPATGGTTFECKQTDGYLKNGSSVYMFVGTDVGKAVDDFADTSCASTSIGKVTSNKSAICVKAGKTATFASDSSNTKYLVERGESVEGTPFQSDENGTVVKRDPNYIIRDIFHDKVSVANIADNSVLDSSTFNSMAATASYKLYDCKEGHCRQTQGYALSGSTMYAFVDDAVGVKTETKEEFVGSTQFVSANGANTAFSTDFKNCDSTYHGKLYIHSTSTSPVNGVFIDCRDTANKVGIDFAAPSSVSGNEVIENHLLLKGSAAPGTPFEDASNNIVVKRDTSYIARNQYFSTVGLFKKSYYTFVDSTGFSGIDTKALKNYFIYDCKDGVCRQTSGYIDGGNTSSKIYAFVGEGSEGYAVDASTSLTEVDSKCDSGEEGKVLKDKTGICYANGKTVLFASGDPLYIMLEGKAVARTPFVEKVNSIPIKRDAKFIVRDQFYTSFDMVKSDGTPIRIDGEEENDFTEEKFEKLIDGTAGSTAPNPIGVVQCNDGICKQSVGYILYKEKVYASDGVSGVVDTTDKAAYVGTNPIDSVEKCDEDHIGLLYNTKDGVCIHEGKGITFGADDNDYMLLKGAIEAGPLANKKSHVHVQRTAKYILTDNFYTGTILVNKVDGILTTDFSDQNSGLAKKPSNFVVVDCINGHCIQTQGYVLNGQKVIGFVDLLPGANASSEPLHTESCSTGSVGKVVGSTGVCISSGNSIPFSTTEAEFIIMKGAAAKGTPFENAYEILAVKRTANYILRDYFYSSLNLVNKVLGSVTSDFETKNTELAAAPSNYVIVECLDGRCKQSEGFVKNNNEIYAFVRESGGTKTAGKSEFVGAKSISSVEKCEKLDATDQDKKGTVGLLISDAAKSGICYVKGSGSKGKIEFKDGDEVYIMMTGTAYPGSIFDDPNNAVPIKHSKNYILKDVFYTAVNILNEDTGEVTTDFNSLSAKDMGNMANNRLIDCVDGVCKPTAGYIQISDETLDYIGSEAAKADSKATTKLNTNNCQNSVGKYYATKGGSATGLCIISGTVNVQFTDDTGIKHVIKKNEGKENTPFVNINDDLLIKHGIGYAIIDKFDSVNLYLESSNQEVYSDFEHDKVVTGDDAIKKKPGSYKIVDCVEGVCKETTGYIKSDDNIYKFITNGGSKGSDILAAGVKSEGDCIKDNAGWHFTDEYGRSGVCSTVGHSISFERPGHYMMMKGTVSNGSSVTDSTKITALGIAVADVPFDTTTAGILLKSGVGYVVTDKFTQDVNIVKVEDGSSTSDLETANAALLANPSDYIIVDCDGTSGVIGCQQTTGYIINNKKVFSFVGEAGGAEVTSSTVTTGSCKPATIGKFIFGENDDVKFCIGSVSNDKSVTLEKPNPAKPKKEMIVKGRMAAGTPFGDSTNVVKQGKSYVIVDKNFAYTDDKVLLVNVDTGAYDDVTSATIDGTTAVVSVIVQYSKDKNECVQTSGYLKDASTPQNIFAFVGNAVGEAATDVKYTGGTISDANACEDGSVTGKPSNIGQLITGGKGVCIYRGVGITFTSASEKILLKDKPAVVNTPFRNTENEVKLKGDSKYIIIDKFYNDGVNLVNKDDGTVVKSDKISSENLSGDNVIVDCVEGVCKRTEGYILNKSAVKAFHGEKYGVDATSDEYIKDSLTKTKEITDPKKCTEESYIGRLYKTNEGVCIGDKIGVEFGVKKGRYIIDGSAESAKGTPFEGTAVALKVGADYIVKDMFYNSGDYCTYPTTDTKEAKRTKICEKNVLDEYYKCENGVCTEKTDGTNDVENGIYILSVDGKKKMYKCAKKHCWAKEYNGMYVVETRDEVEQVVLDDRQLDALDGILGRTVELNSCVRGICTTTAGFIRYGVGPFIVRVDVDEVDDNGSSNGGGPSGPSDDGEESTEYYIYMTLDKFVKCTTETDDGSGSESGSGPYDKVDESGGLLSNMDLCVDWDEKFVKSTGGVGAYDELERLYQRTGVNVVGAVWNGDYVYEEGQVISCVEGDCSYIIDLYDTFKGYLRNADHHTFTEYPLIYCEDEENCKIQAKEANGYYLSKGMDEGYGYPSDAKYNTKYVVCDDQGCVERSIEDENENGDPVLKAACGDDNKYKVIYDRTAKKYKFCKSSGSAVDITESYKVITDNFAPERRFNYPTDLGDVVSRDVLFKLTELSVTTFNGESIPVGYLKGDSDSDYIECRFDEEGERVCEAVEVAESCTTEAEGKLIKDGSDTKLCIDGTEEATVVVDLTDEDEEGVYLLPLRSGLFGIEGRTDGTYYTTVEVKDGSVILKKELKSVKEKYTDYDSTHKRTLYKVFSKEEAEGTAGDANSICTTGSARPFEFVLQSFGVGSDANPEVDYYIEGDNSALQA